MVTLWSMSRSWSRSGGLSTHSCTNQNFEHFIYDKLLVEDILNGHFIRGKGQGLGQGHSIIPFALKQTNILFLTFFYEQKSFFKVKNSVI